MKYKILIVDDEKLKRVTLHDALKRAGYQVHSVADGLDALQMVKNEEWDVAVLDLKLPGMDGFSLLKQIRKIRPNASIIMMTAYGTIHNAVEAMKYGAYDYLSKPFTSDELLIKLKRLFKYRDKLAENIELKKALVKTYRFDNIIGKSKAMEEMYEKIKVIAASDVSVLLEGETGTGKELVAETIHYNSPRREKPFIKLSCVTLTETIIESELFGHEKGAFSGATRTRPGRFELAHKGTLFLDDIDDIPLSIQPKLLRVLQNKEFERVGGEKVMKVDVRVIAASKKELSHLMRQDKFRTDLFYRLNTISLRLPALREKREDIPCLVKHFVDKYTKDRKRHFSPEAVNLLAKYDWPGNIRELEHFVEGLLVMTNEMEISLLQFPKDFLKKVTKQTRFSMKTIRKEILEIEKETIIKALMKYNWMVSKAAKYLNIPRSTLRDRIKKLDIKIEK